MHLYYSSGLGGSERIMKLELRNRRQRVGLYFVREWIIYTEKANESSKPCYRNGAVGFAMGCAGYCSIVSIEADSLDCAGATGWMSRLSARGLVLGRRRDNDARVMALDTAMDGNCGGAVGFAMGCAGRCSNLSIEADSVDRAGAAGRRRGFCCAQLCIAAERSVRSADCCR